MIFTRNLILQLEELDQNQMLLDQIQMVLVTLDLVEIKQIIKLQVVVFKLFMKVAPVVVVIMVIIVVVFIAIVLVLVTVVIIFLIIVLINLILLLQILNSFYQTQFMLIPQLTPFLSFPIHSINQHYEFIKKEQHFLHYLLILRLLNSPLAHEFILILILDLQQQQQLIALLHFANVMLTQRII